MVTSILTCARWLVLDHIVILLAFLFVLSGQGGVSLYVVRQITNIKGVGLIDKTMQCMI